MAWSVDTLLQEINDRGGDAEGVIRHLAMQGTDEESIVPEIAARRSQGMDPSTNRRRAGAFYTPPQLVDLILEHTLEPWLADHDAARPVVLDPSCGTGRFLLAAGPRLAAAHSGRHGGSEADAWRSIGPLLRGFDSDPLATAWLRGRLTALAGGDPESAAGIRTIDAFDDTALPQATVDIVLGNPPFGSPLRSHSQAEGMRRRASKVYGVQIGAYADQASIFLLASARALRPGGRLGMVQPLSLLAARDASFIRKDVLSTCRVTFAWSSAAKVFDAQVHTVAIGLHRDHVAPPIDRWADLPPQQLPSAAPLESGCTWSTLASAAIGVPDPPPLRAGGVLGDIAKATADFRDQYYGLRGCLVEVEGSPAEGVVPIVTSGVLDPAECRWDDRDVRVHGRRWRRPAVRLDLLDASMKQWAASRLVPKVLLPTQTRVLEPALDDRGIWLPSVPVMTITSGRLAHVAAVLACPAISLLSLHNHLGTARSPQAIKLSARDVLTLPTPADDDAWTLAASAFTAAQHAEDATTRLGHLESCARDMHRAYGLTGHAGDATLAWWQARLPGAS